jgi:hypothetical protein
MNDSINPVSVLAQPGVDEVSKRNLKDNYDDVTYAPIDDATLQTHRVVIPLCQLAGICDHDLLAPSYLTAGLRIELSFYQKEHFFVKQGVWNVADTVTITKPEINLECFQLTDSIVRKLSQISASSGLEWYFDAVHHMSSTMATKQVTVQITRALSRCNNVIVKSRHDSAINRYDQDSLASQPWVYDVPKAGADAVAAAEENGVSGNLEAFQVQLGAQFIPSQPIQYREDFLHSAMKTFSQFRRSDEVGGVELPTFTGVKKTQGALAVASTYKPGLAIAAIPLESSSTLQQSGSAISAQRTAVVNLSYANDVGQLGALPGSLRRVDVFCVYSKLCSLFLDSVVVRS